jgi:ribose transport system permease protein
MSSAARVHARTTFNAARPLVALLAVAALFYAIPPHHAIALQDVRTIAVSTIIVATAAIGMTFVIISGGIDLSVGSSVALSGVIAALAARAEWPLPFVVIGALAAGVACGVYNGVLVNLLSIPPFIVTLGTLGLFRGTAKWISGSRTVPAPAGILNTIMLQTPPHPAWILAPGVWVVAAAAAIATLVLHRTVFGRQIVAIGSNADAARYAGIHVRHRRVQVYALGGLFAGLAGLLQFGRVTVGDPTISVGLELDVIAAVVIGGASLSGGAGSVLGAVTAAALMALLRNRFIVYGWPNFAQEMIVGHIIIAAVAIDQWRRARAT